MQEHAPTTVNESGTAGTIDTNLTKAVPDLFLALKTMAGGLEAHLPTFTEGVTSSYFPFDKRQIEKWIEAIRQASVFVPRRHGGP